MSIRVWTKHAYEGDERSPKQLVSGWAGREKGEKREERREIRSPSTSWLCTHCLGPVLKMRSIM